jgi:hypothetical protein
MTKFALEKYKAFPYVAWGLVFSFSFFVFHLTQTLVQATNDLRVSQDFLAAQVRMPIEQVNFTNATSSSHTRK